MLKHLLVLAWFLVEFLGLLYNLWTHSSIDLSAYVYSCNYLPIFKEDKLVSSRNVTLVCLPFDYYHILS